VDYSDLFKYEQAGWQGIHPVLSNDSGMATAHFISDTLAENSEKIIDAQFKASNNIIASINYNAREISKNFSNSIDSLNSTFEWGFSETLWQLEQQQEALKNVIKNLQKPLTIQSVELRERGFYAYRNRMFDDAITDLQHAAEDNRYDFTIYQTLGNIFLFHKYDPENAIDSYQKAAKYSEPRSKKIASFAFLHLGLIYYFIHDYQNAYNSTLKAINLCPNSSMCYYEHARYCAKLNKTEEAIENLKKIIYQEPFYCAKINSEPDFNPLSNKIHEIFETFYDQLESISQKRIETAKHLLNRAEQLRITSEQLNSFSNSLKKAERSYSKHSILDFQCSIIESENTIKNLLILMQKYLEEQKTDKSKILQEIPRTIHSKYGSKIYLFTVIVGVLIILWRIIYHVMDGIYQWGAGIGIIAGIIVGVIDGMIYAIVPCGIILVGYRILSYKGIEGLIKREQESTNYTLNKINKEFIKIKEENDNFSYTFNQNIPLSK
jgi:tetratricopeptide (TPR) repeat protein